MITAESDTHHISRFKPAMKTTRHHSLTHSLPHSLSLTHPPSPTTHPPAHSPSLPHSLSLTPSLSHLSPDPVFTITLLSVLPTASIHDYSIIEHIIIIILVIHYLRRVNNSCKILNSKHSQIGYSEGTTLVLMWFEFTGTSLLS